MSWWNRKDNFIALDMGQRSIKGVSLTKEKGRLKLAHAFIHDFSITNPEYPNNTNIIKNLQMITEVQKLKDYEAITNIGNGNLHSFELVLPLMTQKELEIVIKNEIEKNINYPIEKAIYDYLIMDQKNDDDPNKITIRVFTLKRNKVEMLAKMITSAELKPKVIDSDIDAILRCLDYNDYLKPGHLHVIVDMAETHTTITLSLGNRLITSNHVDLSMGFISHRLQEAFTAKYTEVEEIKKEMMVHKMSDETAPVITFQIYKKDKSPREQLKLKFANDNLMDILAKIQENIEYFKEFHFNKWPVNAFYFIGGGANVNGLCEAFEEHYEIPCIIPNPLKNIDINEKQLSFNPEVILDQQQQLVLAVGLALRRCA